MSCFQSDDYAAEARRIILEVKDIQRLRDVNKKDEKTPQNQGNFNRRKTIHNILQSKEESKETPINSLETAFERRATQMLNTGKFAHLY